MALTPRTFRPCRLASSALGAAAALLLAVPGVLDAPVGPGPVIAALEAADSGILTLAIDPGRSAIDFTISRKGETIKGAAHVFSGEVTVDPQRPGSEGSVVLRVEAASLETGNRVRDHKMRASHLEVDRFPEILFRSASIRVSRGAEDVPAQGAKPGTEAVPGPLLSGSPRRALVEGTLSLHGVDRTILLPATIRYDSGALQAEGDLIVRLTDHGIPLPRFLWIVLDDEVKVHFLFVAGRGSRTGAGLVQPRREIRTVI